MYIYIAYMAHICHIHPYTIGSALETAPFRSSTAYGSVKTARVSSRKSYGDADGAGGATSLRHSDSVAPRIEGEKG